MLWSPYVALVVMQSIMTTFQPSPAIEFTALWLQLRSALLRTAYRSYENTFAPSTRRLEFSSPLCGSPTPTAPSTYSSTRPPTNSSDVQRRLSVHNVTVIHHEFRHRPSMCVCVCVCVCSPYENWRRTSVDLCRMQTVICEVIYRRLTLLTERERWGIDTLFANVLVVDQQTVQTRVCSAGVTALLFQTILVLSSLQ